MNRFTSAVWLIVKIGFFLTLLPVVYFILAQLAPALLTTRSNPWVQ